MAFKQTVSRSGRTLSQAIVSRLSCAANMSGAVASRPVVNVVSPPLQQPLPQPLQQPLQQPLHPPMAMDGLYNTLLDSSNRSDRRMDALLFVIFRQLVCELGLQNLTSSSWLANHLLSNDRVIEYLDQSNVAILQPRSNDDRVYKIPAHRISTSQTERSALVVKVKMKFKTVDGARTPFYIVIEIVNPEYNRTRNAHVTIHCPKTEQSHTQSSCINFHTNDGRRLLLTSCQNGTFQLYSQDSSGSPSKFFEFDRETGNLVERVPQAQRQTVVDLHARRSPRSSSPQSKRTRR